MGALHINGQKTTGLNITLADGVFIDANDEITSGTYSGDLTYTATEDCFFTVVATCKASGSGITSYLSVDDVEVCSFINPNQDQRFSVFAKAGQVIKVHESGTTTNSYAVYGIQQGTIEGKLQPVIYSIEEREVGVWIDGKPLYQKTVIKDSNFVSGANQIAHNISNVGEIISNESTLYYNNGDCVHLPAITLNSSGWTAKTRDFGDTYFYLDLGNDMLSYVASASFTLLYTKTTDQPGAGTWTPDGAYTHHYSTDEKVVGTWVDGKTIYEKTVNCGTLPNGTSKTVAHNISNLGNIVSIKGIAYETNGNTLPMPYLNADNFNYTVQLEVNSTNIVFNTKIDFTAYTGFITIQYTKSS